MKIVHVLNGPNINMLELRPSEHYHHGGRGDPLSYADLRNTISQEGERLGVDIRLWQSNSESEMVSAIQGIAADNYNRSDNRSGVIINAGAYSHTSIAIRDALELLACSTLPIPIVEVHLSNIYAREQFRHHSHISAICHGVISGLGVYSYLAALHYILDFYSNTDA